MCYAYIGWDSTYFRHLFMVATIVTQRYRCNRCLVSRVFTIVIVLYFYFLFCRSARYRHIFYFMVQLWKFHRIWWIHGRKLNVSFTSLFFPARHLSVVLVAVFLLPQARPQAETAPPQDYDYMPGSSPAHPNLPMAVCQQQATPSGYNVTAQGKAAEEINSWCS